MSLSRLRLRFVPQAEPVFLRLASSRHCSTILPDIRCCNKNGLSPTASGRTQRPCSPPGSIRSKSKRLPSRAQSVGYFDSGECSNRRLSAELARSLIKRSEGPSGLERNITCLPSGDITGMSLFPGGNVRRVVVFRRTSKIDTAPALDGGAG